LVADDALTNVGPASIRSAAWVSTDRERHIVQPLERQPKRGSQDRVDAHIAAMSAALFPVIAISEMPHALLRPEARPALGRFIWGNAHDSRVRAGP
jgi:hypothetical protein